MNLSIQSKTLCSRCPPKRVISESVRLFYNMRKMIFMIFISLNEQQIFLAHEKKFPAF